MMRDSEHGDAARAPKAADGVVGDEASFLQFLKVLLGNRYLVVGSAVAGGVLMVMLHFLLFEPAYTSQATFIPQGAQGTSSTLSAVAGQFGVSLPSEPSAESPAFYVDLIRSREILRPILTDSIAINEDGGTNASAYQSRPIIDYLDLENEYGALRRAEGLRWLQEAVTVSVVPETGVVDFQVATPWPELSEFIATRILEMLNDFNLRRRQSRAAEERVFIEGRLEEVRDQLLHAEQRLERFLAENRAFENSPELSFEYDRLQRQVNMRQQLYTGLHASYEEMRIAEVRNTPVITVVEPPEQPIRPDPSRLSLRAFLGLMLGMVIGVFGAFGRELISRSREQGGSEHREFWKIWEEAVNDLKRWSSFFRGT